MFVQVSVILSTGRGHLADTTLGRHTPRADTSHPPGRHLPPPGQTPPTPLGRHPLGRHPNPPSDGHCSRRYASYWNAFLFYQQLLLQYSIPFFAYVFSRSASLSVYQFLLPALYHPFLVKVRMTHLLPDGNNLVLNVLEDKYWTLHTIAIKTGLKDRKNSYMNTEAECLSLCQWL